MAQASRISLSRDEPLSLFLAMNREVSGRRPWELCLLPRPHTPEVSLFTAGLRTLRDSGLRQLPIELAGAADAASFASSLAAGGGAEAAGWDLIRQSMSAVAGELRSAIERAAPSLPQARTYIEDTIIADEKRCVDVLAEALGTPGHDRALAVFLVPFAPFPPGSAFLVDRDTGQPEAAYLDYRRYPGATMLEGVLTVLSWHMLAWSASGESLSRTIATELTGDPATWRRLRAIVMKMLIGLTAEHLVRHYEPHFRGTIVAFGQDLRFPRLLSAIRAPWQHYLNGRTSRARALALINERLASQPASWFAEQVDASSLAADFYLLEWLAAQGDRDAASCLAGWQPRLAADFARHVDFAIGAELAHYDGIPLATTSGELTSFIQQTCQGNSLLGWPPFRRQANSDAYRLAEAAFLGPGAEYGGDAWAPVARLLAQHADGTLSDRLFIDRCFTLEHNNGCLFDKFFDTWDMLATLDAQAEGDLSALATRASAQVRRLWDRHETAGQPPRGQLSPTAPRAGAFHDWPPPGSAGCGSNAELAQASTRVCEYPGKPLFRGKMRVPLHRGVPELRSARAVMRTTLGSITLVLDPLGAPLAVGSFVQLARGEVEWRDPATGGPGTGPFYDDTRFHRVVPDLYLQAGDRTGTGRGGPGFRYDEEYNDQTFDEPYRVAMVNTGVVTNGSQFFITLSKAPYLNGQYTIIGEVADDGSREVAHRLSRADGKAQQELRIERIEVAAR